MSKMLSRIADKLLPQTSAAAGCAPGCWMERSSTGGQFYEYKCCYNPNCSVRCFI
ncbi:hypothetical protein [Streptomyces tendae]|uniref:hypothetical protein n=1 Tax=Streptomyces tendae TaxID=1932 RepID=UPI0036B31C48